MLDYPWYASVSDDTLEQGDLFEDCPVFLPPDDWSDGSHSGYHLLAPCQLAGFERELRIVDFRRVHSLPLGFIRNRSAPATSRIRLLPPYREHLAQAFARFFMRVGLPIDIPPFR